ncbi:MAG: HEAT repeat domain-containing protein [SAR324 cluster bacterium]|nr:HEAT repeat domain-containing protein [SAR324 cluster bacterium]
MLRKLSLLCGIALVMALAACSSLDKAEQLYQQGEKDKATDIAIGFLDSSDKGERTRAADLLGKIGGDKAGKALTEKIDDPDPEVQATIIVNVGKTGYTPASAKLVKMVPDARGEIFEAVGKAIRQLGDPAISLLVEDFHAPSKKASQEQIKKMLVYIGPGVTESIARSMKNKSYFENKANFDILIEIRNPAVASMMLPYIEDEEVAHLVVEGLTKLGSMAVDPVMEKLRIVSQASGNAALKERLVKVLGQIKDPRATTILEPMSQDESDLVRQAVDRALYQIRGF